MISPEQEALLGQVFESYLTQHHQEDMLQLLAETSEETHRPVSINAMTLFEANMEVADYLNAYPSDVLTIFDKVLRRTALKFSEKAFPKESNRDMRCFPHTRITGLPLCPEMTRDVIPRSRDVGRFLSVTGTVIRTSAAKVLEYEREYICASCRSVFTKRADFEHFYSFSHQMSCPNPAGCKSTKFSSLSRDAEPAACKDYQEVKIQEQVQRLSVGKIPRSMVVVLEDDLVDCCKSGDDVTVYGVMCQRWKPCYDGAPCEVELVLRANNVEVANRSSQQSSGAATKDIQKEYEDFWRSYTHFPLAGRNLILLSLCPQIFGMYVIKLAVALVLAGGVERRDSSGAKVRGECHMLLVGDPGTGKSQLLKYAAKIIPRSILTTGFGSTSAGLTVAAVKDGNDWHLEAGALVLADGGLCCIDEFNSIKEHERISIHEAMEQQSISVAKAGIVCKLNTRTSILAASNPKVELKPGEPLSVSVALASPLLSRFDLVLVLMDNRSTEWDRVISSFILEDRELCSASADLWSLEKMKAYFGLIKQLRPQMSQDANAILTRYYQRQRRSEGRSAARTTIRMLESLSRLAEAHSRLMYREVVTVEDAVMAVSVMDCSMQGDSLLGSVNALSMPFPAEPFEQYKAQCRALLEELNLPLLLQKELGRLESLRSRASGGPPSDVDTRQPGGTTVTPRPVTRQPLEDFLAPASPSDDQPPGTGEENPGGASPRTPQQWKKPAAPEAVSRVIQKSPRNARNGSGEEQKQQQRREGQRGGGAPGAASHAQKRPLPDRTSQAEPAPGRTPEELRAKLAAFRFTASTRLPGRAGDPRVPQQDGPSRGTPAGVGGPASPQVGRGSRRASSTGRKRKHPGHD